jgi:hypothetical protein
MLRESSVKIILRKMASKGKSGPTCLTKQFDSFPKLYHFTNMYAALQIVESKKLKFSKLTGTNDLCENFKNPYCNDEKDSDFKENQIDDIRKEIQKREQISLTVDKKDASGLRGFELQQMWGLYADKCFGVCLVFDKSKFVDLLKMKNLDYREVVYSKDVSGDVSVEDNGRTITNISSDNGKKADPFFQKRKEWEHEQEFRVLTKFDDTQSVHYFDFGESLKYVIMNKAKTIDEKGSLANSVECKVLEKVLNGTDVKILFYNSFCSNYNLLDEFGSVYWSSDANEFNENSELDIDSDTCKQSN